MQTIREIDKEQMDRSIGNNQYADKQIYLLRKEKLCVTNLSNYYDRVTQTVQKEDSWVDIIYLNFIKAVDSPSSKAIKEA